MFSKIIIKKIAKIITVLSMLLLSACSTSFAYNNLPWLSSFWVDDYIDLNKSQAKQLKQIIENTRNWHRQTELLKYKQDLTNLQAMFNSQLNKEELTKQITLAKGHWGNLLDYASQPLITLAKTLTSKQRKELIDNITADINDEFKEHNELSLQEHKDMRLDKQFDYFKQWLNKLTPEQVRLIKAANEQHINTFLLWQDYKRDRLRALEQTFSNLQLDEQQFATQLEIIITDRDAFIGDELKAKNENNLVLYINLLIDLNNTLSKQQRKSANEHFDDLMQTINELRND
ncbi:DUF6279 family lipoprotein [Pseudoalteromonas aliena]|uniref:Lipoprotein n=1 Tax=Pseudoalteromonas aliena SW19 TaxID=1314866 RepID=A0ABR9E4V5_9GAMM|nr:DUF6279 family lipoprotein [Pseudoalteromonas aliena]MBE0361608.1 hypothetical protein [Pseudoalteromonas aliena SW19]